MEDVLVRRAVTVVGIARCRARVVGRRQRLRVRLHVRLQPDVTRAVVLPALTAVVPRAEAATAPRTVHTRVRFSHRPHRVPHVR
ncbi:hypothetical protein [Streptomyces sp. 142MFCol3.1]|uniref:hypothetical protein n=1 Tax=Streptomyces sp. 142MFCol3.1 TaxID=1172179 RepID=UPI000413F677|nr:hypothetical protein [Streptomyces sp. 142MFCol3.1]